ncbi:MAG: NDP-sugar synthase [Intestinibacillus sp.]
MTKQPVLVVMAAGMGSRYGGLKQIDPVGPNGQIIMDYSLYDAYRAGFRRVVFIIRPELRESFEEAIGRRAAETMEVSYVYQTVDRLPEGSPAPAGRQKPLGTGHAVWCAREAVGGAPFAVINADDFYGAEAFAALYDFLKDARDDETYRYCMVGYRLENTLTENGTVSRGVCRTDAAGNLTSIIERTAIRREPDGVIRCEGGELPEGTPVSLNVWGFTPSFLEELTGMLRRFVAKELPLNPEKAELYLPFAVDELIRAGKATARVLTTPARWFGVTYREDKPAVQQAIAALTGQGIYPAVF